LICDLFNQGFEHVEGVDKFVPQEIDYGYGVKVMKKELTDLQSHAYDLIMMHHVLEHMDQQKEALTDCHRLLKKEGCLLVRIPLLGEAWERYRGDWVQLDAPRHFFLHTLKSMAILAEDAGFEIRETMFDSTGFQFWASELYKRNIPLFSAENNYNLHPIEKEFSQDELKAFEIEAEKLNTVKRGDSVAFYLYRKA
jgi:predicted SAM-dependent methyltransferase